MHEHEEHEHEEHDHEEHELEEHDHEEHDHEEHDHEEQDQEEYEFPDEASPSSPSEEHLEEQDQHHSSPPPVAEPPPNQEQPTQLEGQQQLQPVEDHPMVEDHANADVVLPKSTEVTVVEEPVVENNNSLPSKETDASAPTEQQPQASQPEPPSIAVKSESLTSAEDMFTSLLQSFHNQSDLLAFVTYIENTFQKDYQMSLFGTHVNVE